MIWATHDLQDVLATLLARCRMRKVECPLWVFECPVHDDVRHPPCSHDGGESI